MFIPARFFRSNLIPAKVRSASPLLLAISFVFVAVTLSLLADPACTVPGVTTVTDSGTNDACDMQSNHDIISTSVAYPFTSTSSPDLLYFTIKVGSLTTPLTPGSFYFTTFTIDGAPEAAGNVHGVRMVVDNTGMSPTFETYTAGAANGGQVDGRFVASSAPAEPGSNFTPGGTITIIARPSRVGVPSTGTHRLTNWNGAVAQTAQGVVTGILDGMPSTSGTCPVLSISRGGNDFTVMSNQTCNSSPTPTPTPTPTPPPHAWCSSPYVPVQGGAASANPDPTGELTIESVSVGEPFVGCSGKRLTLVLKVSSMDPSGMGMTNPAPNTFWEVFLTVPGANNSTGANQTVFVQFETAFSGPSGAFSYGWVDNTDGFNQTEAAGPVTGTIAPDGTITMNLNTGSTLNFTTPTGGVAPPWSISPSQWVVGEHLTNVKGETDTCVGGGVVCATVVDAQTTGDGLYQLNGNVSCSNPPVAALSATPTMGNAPLAVNFDASGSIPGQCGTINSYIFDFADGNQLTQSGATASHTYNTGGVTYPARVRVTNTVGLTSSNIAEQDITVNPSGPPILTSVVSRKLHGAAGQKDVLLPLPPYTATNHRGVECRTTGNTGTTGVDYMVVFTFLNNITSCGTAGTTGGAVVSGPNSNQCTENLTGLPDQQYTTISLNGVSDAAGGSGDVVGPQMGLLVGDVNANGLVNSTDTSQVQAQSGQPVTGDLGSGNYRKDVNANGLINSTDTSAVQSRSGHGLPSAP